MRGNIEMACFCQFCGKRLEDFELCNCEQAASFRNQNADQNVKMKAAPPPVFQFQKMVSQPDNYTANKTENSSSESMVQKSEFLKKAFKLLSRIYIIDFLIRLVKKNNIGTILFLILNVGLYVFLFTGGLKVPEMIPLSIVLYLFSLIIALSPIGEFMVRIQCGCKSLHKFQKKYDTQRIEKLFDEVYQKAREKDPSISPRVKLFISRDLSPNAFATGRRTVCSTIGLLDMSDEQIKGILGHEFGHIAHKDTDLLLVILVSNLLLSFLFVVYRIIVTLVVFLIGEGESALGGIGNLISRILIDMLLVAVIRLWTKIGILLVRHSSRQNEFEADKYSCELGYGEELSSALKALDSSPHKNGFWCSLQSSHPDTVSRVEKIFEWMKNHMFPGQRAHQYGTPVF